MKNCPCVYSMKTWIVKDIFKILDDTLPELNEIFWKKYMQMDNARINWILDALRFYKENNIVVIDWLAYNPDLNLIEKCLGKHKRKVK